VDETTLLLAIDGGGTRCRARLVAPSGTTLGEATAGPANIRLGLEPSFRAMHEATAQCLAQAGLLPSDLARIVACLALAGASEPLQLSAAQAYRLPFRNTIVTTDAHAACVGAHGGRDGGVIVAGTGAIGWAVAQGRQLRIGGWGLPVSDEGSGAWLGCEAIRRVLWAHDGRISWTGLLTCLFEKFRRDPHAIVRWTATATPRDFGTLAPSIVDYASCGDPAALELLDAAARHLDALALRLISLGTQRLAMVGGLAPHLAPRLAAETRRHIVAPEGDALDGALRMARAAADTLASVVPLMEQR
jgi:glucosamine kinase